MLLFDVIPYLNIFLQMMLASFVLIAKVNKRSYFWVRILSSLVVGGVGTYFMVYFEHWGVWGFVLVMAVVTLIVFLCYDLNIIHSFIISVIAYTTQNLAFTIASLIYDQHLDWISWAVFIVLVALIFFLFTRNTNIKEIFGINNLKSLLVASVSLVAIIFLNAEFNNESAVTIGKVFLLIADVLAVCLLFSITKTSQSQREKKDIENLLKQEESLHKLSKENIELINMKCHDLKHFVNTMKDECKMSDELKEIEDALDVYDSNVKTGNEDLDIVITEKNMRCRKSGIVLSCIIDGNAISFMSPGDIYSLFGNALENSIEYLEKIEDTEKRIIDFRILRKENFTTVKVENYSENVYNLNDDIPTSKEDKESHGYGLKSIKYIVAKYDGKLVITQDDSKFTLNIMFPIKKSYNMPLAASETADENAQLPPATE